MSNADMLPVKVFPQFVWFRVLLVVTELLEMEEEGTERGLEAHVAWLLFRQSALQQLGHVITRVNDIENKRRATAADQLPRPRCLHQPDCSRSFSTRDSGGELSHFSARPRSSCKRWECLEKRKKRSSPVFHDPLQLMRGICTT